MQLQRNAKEVMARARRPYQGIKFAEVDLLLIGEEKSFDIAVRFATELKKIFPLLDVRVKVDGHPLLGG